MRLTYTRLAEIDADDLLRQARVIEVMAADLELMVSAHGDQTQPLKTVRLASLKLAVQTLHKLRQEHLELTREGSASPTLD